MIACSAGAVLGIDGTCSSCFTTIRPFVGFGVKVRRTCSTLTRHFLTRRALPGVVLPTTGSHSRMSTFASALRRGKGKLSLPRRRGGAENAPVDV